MMLNELDELTRIAKSVPETSFQVAKARYGVVRHDPDLDVNVKVAECTPEWARFFAAFDPPTVLRLLAQVAQKT